MSEEAKHGGPQGRQNTLAVASAICLLAAVGLLLLAWRLEWWTPGLGFLTASLAVKAAVFLPVGVVGVVAWRKRRR